MRRAVAVCLAVVLGGCGQDKSTPKGGAPASPNIGRQMSSMLTTMNPDAYLEQLKDKDPKVRHKAVESLAKIGAIITPRLGAALRDPDPRIRTGAAKALGLIGPDARGAIPELTKAAKDKDEGVREAAAHALQKIQKEAAPSKDHEGAARGAAPGAKPHAAAAPSTASADAHQK